jgi:hypothetical protein
VKVIWRVIIKKNCITLNELNILPFLLEQLMTVLLGHKSENWITGFQKCVMSSLDKQQLPECLSNKHFSVDLMQCFLLPHGAKNRAFLHRMMKHLLILPFHHAVEKIPLENKNVSEKSPCYQIQVQY